MKRSPLVAKAPLRRYVPLVASRGPKQPRAKPAAPARVRDALARRSGGWCEMALPVCTGRATDPCHRVSRGMGGRRGDAEQAAGRLSNLVHGCRACHTWCHARPADAYEAGLMLRAGQDPAREPVLLRRHDPLPVYLDDAGGWHRFEEVGC